MCVRGVSACVCMCVSRENLKQYKKIELLILKFDLNKPENLIKPHKNKFF